jgi:hypothetical protein
MSNTDLTKTPEWTQVFTEDKQCLPLIRHTPCYLYIHSIPVGYYYTQQTTYIIIILFVWPEGIRYTYFLLGVFHYGMWRIGSFFSAFQWIIGGVLLTMFSFSTTAAKWSHAHFIYYILFLFIIFLFLACICLYWLIDRTSSRLFTFR